MAGAGYKLFNTGDVLTAAQVNTYLQEQVVMVFANAAARTTALSGVLAEGMVSYLKDTDALEIYSGSAWVGYGSGDITGVTAGTGISGGGTSGTVTITNSMATEITAAGDIIVGTGSGTFDNLPIGTTGQVLTADTTVSPYKVKWAAAAGGGKVLQVVSANTSTSVQTFSTTYADSGLSASITPSATSSKILILISQNFWTGCNANSVYAYAQLLRGSTKIQEKWWGIEAARNGSSPLVQAMENPLIWLDSPSTTSSTTYKTQFKLGQADVGGWGGYANYNSTNSSITLLEIGA
jgi:hypothetical protein